MLLLLYQECDNKKVIIHPSIMRPIKTKLKNIEVLTPCDRYFFFKEKILFKDISF